MTGIPLEPTAAQRRSMTREVVDFLDDWLERRSSAPASSPPPDDRLINELLEGPPETGRDLVDLLDTIDRATETGFDTAGAGFFSYIPSGGLYSAALGALIGSAMNQYTGASHASPGNVAIEESVVRWMVELFGLPPSAGGVLVSGGSIANQIAVVTARSRFGDDFGDGVVYVSTHVHHSVQKAARIAGISMTRVRSIETDGVGRLDARALAGSVAADIAAGLRPMMVVATAGTTDTGAVDAIDAAADIAAEAGAWFHVDAAYGGFFQLTDRGRERFGGIERADSITVDAHKSLFLPFGVGGLLVRDRAAVVNAHEGAGAYMQDIEYGTLPFYLEMGPELTRPNRGAQVWLALHLHGVRRFRDELDRMLDLARRAADALTSMPEVEVLGVPELSVVAFRAVAGDGATRAILDALNASREIHVSSTTVGGRVHVRLAFLHQRTTDERVDRAIEIIESSVRPS